MSEQKWLNVATSKIRFRPDREAVWRELEAHFEELREASGLEEEAAVERMGDPLDIAEELGRLHRPWLGYLWRVSQVLLWAGVGLCVLLCAVRFLFRSILPEWAVYDYLTWEYETAADGSEQYELVPNGSVTTGGYTIRVDRALMGLAGDPERESSHWNLTLYFHIDTGWRGEALDWALNVIGEVRDSAGNIYGPQYAGPERYCRCGGSESAWGLGQKAALELNNVPEDAEWIEFDIGFGSLQRTLHFDLREAAV